MVRPHRGTLSACLVLTLCSRPSPTVDRVVEHINHPQGEERPLSRVLGALNLEVIGRI